MVKRLVSIGSVFCVLGILLAAGAAAQEGSGGTRSPFALGAGARAIALGGAFAATGDDPSVIFYNPAGLALNRYTAVVASHAQLFSGFGDAGYEFLGLAYPTLSAGSIGLGILSIGTGEIRGFDEFSRETGELTYRESEIMLGYAYRLPWRFFGDYAAGATVKALNQRVGDFKDTGPGLDVGFIYRPSFVSHLSIGCSLQDLVGAETKLVTVTDKVDRTVMVGAGYTRPFANGSALSLAVQMNKPQRDKTEIRFGAEYLVKRLLGVRVGYDGDKITFGLGVAWRGFSVDYGYFSRDEAGSAHPISVGGRIGPSTDERLAARERMRAADEEKRIRQMLAGRIGSHLAAAEKFRQERANGKALDELKIALEYDPTNAAAAETLAVVERAILREEEARTQDAEKAALINQHFKLGLEYYSKDDYVLSRAEWRSVLALDPANEKAREYLRSTDEKLTGFAAEHRSRALDLERRGELPAALGEWNMVRTFDPESAEAKEASDRINARLNAMSRDYTQTANKLRVRELFDGAVKSFGDGRYQECARQCREVLALDPGHQEARKLLLRAQRRMTPLTASEKEQVRVLYIEGMKYFTQNEYAKAIERWRKILDIDPDNESVAKNIDEAQKRLGNAGGGGSR